MNVAVNQHAPVRARGEIAIPASTAVVWSVLTAIDDWPRWQGEVTEATLLGPLGEGTEFKWKAGAIPFRSRIHTMVENRMFGWTGKTLGASAIHNWWFTESDGVTTVVVEESLDGLLPRLLRSAFQESLDAGIEKSLGELRVAAETKVA